ncbi:hypothetical protein HK096_009484, partial [Nowakowskiella sp. JEL0078]
MASNFSGEAGVLENPINFPTDDELNNPKSAVTVTVDTLNLNYVTAKIFDINSEMLHPENELLSDSGSVSSSDTPLATLINSQSFIQRVRANSLISQPSSGNNSETESAATASFFYSLLPSSNSNKNRPISSYSRSSFDGSVYSKPTPKTRLRHQLEAPSIVSSVASHDTLVNDVAQADSDPVFSYQDDKFVDELANEFLDSRFSTAEAFQISEVDSRLASPEPQFIVPSISDNFINSH